MYFAEIIRLDIVDILTSEKYFLGNFLTDILTLFAFAVQCLLCNQAEVNVSFFCLVFVVICECT